MVQEHAKDALRLYNKINTLLGYDPIRFAASRIDMAIAVLDLRDIMKVAHTWVGSAEHTVRQDALRILRDAGFLPNYDEMVGSTDQTRTECDTPNDKDQAAP